MKVIIDSREQPIWVKRFEKEGFEVEVTALAIGDFYLPEKNIIFEHKTISDFCSSIVGGHLQKQLMQQEENFEKSYLILTGCWQGYVRFARTPFKTKEYITGFLAHLRHYQKTKVIHSEWDTHVPLILKKIYEKSDNDLSIKDTELLRSKLNYDDFKLRVMMSFENVGIKKAKEFMENENVKKAMDVFLESLEKSGDEKLRKIIVKNREAQNGTNV